MEKKKVTATQAFFLLCLAILLLLWFLLYLRALSAEKTGKQGVTLTWKTQEMSWEEAVEAKNEKREDSEAWHSNVYLYLWEETEGQAENPETGVSLPLQVVSGIGDMEQTMGLSFASGWYGTGCLISQKAAEKLWGSTDIIGKALLINGEYFYVTGVTKEKKQKVYIPEKEEQKKKSHLEVYVGDKAAASEAAFTQKGLAQAIVSRHGWKTPDSFEDNGWLSAWHITFVRLLIVLFAVIIFFKWKKNKITTVTFLVIIFLLLRWSLKDFTIPEEWIPSAWSDFEFWGEKWKERF